MGDINVTVKGVGNVAVPDTWTDEQIQAYLTQKYKPAPTTTAVPPATKARLKAEGELGPFASMVRGANRGGASLMQLIANMYGVAGNPEAMMGFQQMADERNSLPSGGGVSDVVEQAVRAAPSALAGVAGGAPALAATVAAENLHRGPAEALGRGGVAFAGAKAADAILPHIMPWLANRATTLSANKVGKFVDWLTKTSWGRPPAAAAAAPIEAAATDTAVATIPPPIANPIPSTMANSPGVYSNTLPYIAPKPGVVANKIPANVHAGRNVASDIIPYTSNSSTNAEVLAWMEWLKKQAAEKAAAQTAGIIKP